MRVLPGTDIMETVAILLTIFYCIFSNNKLEMAGKPKRHLSAFKIWFEEVRISILRENPQLKVTEVAKKAGELWRLLQNEAKSKEATKLDYSSTVQELERYDDNQRSSAMKIPKKSLDSTLKHDNISHIDSIKAEMLHQERDLPIENDCDATADMSTDMTNVPMDIENMSATQEDEIEDMDLTLMNDLKEPEEMLVIDMNLTLMYDSDIPEETPELIMDMQRSKRTTINRSKTSIDLEPNRTKVSCLPMIFSHVQNESHAHASTIIEYSSVSAGTMNLPSCSRSDELTELFSSLKCYDQSY